MKGAGGPLIVACSQLGSLIEGLCFWVIYLLLNKVTMNIRVEKRTFYTEIWASMSVCSCWTRSVGFLVIELCFQLPILCPRHSLGKVCWGCSASGLVKRDLRPLPVFYLLRLPRLLRFETSFPLVAIEGQLRRHISV